jgi:hypothetical protein
MAQILVHPTPIPATNGVNPNRKSMVTQDNFRTITAAGYMNTDALQNYPLSVNDILDVFYNVTNYGLPTQSQSYGEFTVSISNGTITLVETNQSSGVTYTAPSIANHIAYFTNTAGNISQDGATVINGGNIQAGLSGTAGTVYSFPGTATNGKFGIAAVNDSGNRTVTLSNQGFFTQDTVFVFPDPTVATCNVAVIPNALVNNNVIRANGVGSILQDAGYYLKANTTASYAGGGTSNAFTATGVTAGMIITANILTSTNAVSIVKVVPGSNIITITFSADPGAATTVNWIAMSQSA